MLNHEQQQTTSKQRTTNNEQRATNNEQCTTNDKHQSIHNTREINTKLQPIRDLRIETRTTHEQRNKQTKHNKQSHNTIT